MLKAVVKHSGSGDAIRHRVIPPDVLRKWAKEIEELKHEITGVLQEEKEEKEVGQARLPSTSSCDD